LAIELSKLKPHPHNSVELEQYATEGDLAAFWILAIDQLDNLENKTVVDLGSGNGILGLGTAYLGAHRICLVEADEDAHLISKQNSDKIVKKFETDISSIHAKIGSQEIEIPYRPDIVVMNPPWGFQTEKADRPLLELAFSLDADAIYVLHSAKAKHIEAMAKDFGYHGEIVFETDFRLPAIYSHHSKNKSTTEARCWRFHKSGDAKLIEND
jgi:putative methylase